MAITARIDPIGRDISLMINDALGPEARSKMLADFAREQIASAAAENRQATGREVTHDVFVDGRKGASIDSVRPEGVVVALFDLMDDLFEWIGAMLVQNSPVRSGLYSGSHVFFADGVEVTPGDDVPPASEYVFINVQPYARKIELGRSPQAPEGVYEAVAVMAKRRFGNVANIKFSYRSFQEGGLAAYLGTGTGNARNRKKNGRFAATPLPGADARKRERATRQPAVVITPYGGM